MQVSLSYPNLRRKPFSISPLSTMLAVGLPYMAFFILMYVFPIPSLLGIFIINGC